MTDGVTIKIRRKDRLLKKLSKMAPHAREELAEANDKSAFEMRSLAQQFAPVRTGSLVAGIQVRLGGEVDQRSGTPVPAGAAMVVADAYHSRWIEFGTSPHVQGGVFAGTMHPGTIAQPFFFPAYRVMRKRHKGRASRALRKAMKRAIS